MTPKEKAEEIYGKYWVYFTTEESVNSIFKHAKQCALIAANEMLETLWDLDKNEFENNYWQRVKEEIINL